MKRIKSLIACLLLACAIITPVAITTGCRVPSQQKFAVNTITTTHLAVDAALDSYLDLVVAGKIATNSVPAVMASYGVYQLTYNSALVVVLNNSNAPAPPALSDAAVKFTDTIAAAKKGSL